MTKEQEVIKNIKTYIHDWINESVDEDGYERYVIDEWDKEFMNDIETVLSMLKEKNKEIELYKKKNTELSNQLLMLYREQDNYNARIEKKNAEIEKYKNMIIEHKKQLRQSGIYGYDYDLKID